MGGEVGRMGVGDGGDEGCAFCGVEDGEEGGGVVGRLEGGDGVEGAPGVGRLEGFSCWLGEEWCGREEEGLWVVEGIWVLTERERTMTPNSGEARSSSAMYLPKSPRPAIAITSRGLGIG